MNVIHGGGVWDAGSPSRWLDFSASLRPEGPPEWVREVMAEAQKSIAWYPDLTMRRARKGLSDYLGVPEDHILPVAGGIAAIDLALSVCSGKVFIIPPTFGEYAARAALYGRQVETWPGRCGENDSLVLCNPNNPTGEARSREELLSLLETVRSNGGNLVVDEAFIDYCPEYSLRENIGPGLILAGSLSKILGVPGIRIGYLCAVPETIQRLQLRMLPWSVDALATEIAVRLPDHKDEIIRDAERNTVRRERFSSQLRQLGAEVYPSRGNFLLADFCRDMSSAAVRLRSRGILVRTCSSFGLPGSFWRLAVRTEDENTRLITELEEILHER